LRVFISEYIRFTAVNYGFSNPMKFWADNFRWKGCGAEN